VRGPRGCDLLCAGREAATGRAWAGRLQLAVRWPGGCDLLRAGREAATDCALARGPRLAVRGPQGCGLGLWLRTALMPANGG
jgi:hypothetical protein